MAEPFIGEIKLVPYNFAPRGYALCQGQLMPIAQNTALFSLLGTTYGGNGQTTFALPDLQGRAVVGKGQGFGLSNIDQGQEGGQEFVTLSPSEIPAHTHSVNVSGSAATSADPVNRRPAVATPATGNSYGDATGQGMAAGAIQSAGGSSPHENRQPYLTLNYIIAVQGIFPPHS
jgi:microcystin-dependent protein